MFISLENLNEGGANDSRFEGRKRELYEGENPKSIAKNWNSCRGSSHVNMNWQKLRK